MKSRSRSILTRKTSFEDTKYLLISGSSPDIAGNAQTIEFDQTLNDWIQDRCALRRSSSAESGFVDEFSCNICPPKRCYCNVVAPLVSKDMKGRLTSPSLMRRRNAICDEIEKRTLDWPGKTLRQRRVDMLRTIALMQFSLL